MQKGIKPFFRASVRPDGVLELLMYEQIGQDYWSGEGVTAKSVKQQIDQAGTYSSILVRINSPGGDAFEGVAIGNLLKSTGKPVNTCIDGIAASAASIVAMAGSTITMASNAMMMIHKAWSFSMGNSDDMRKMADTLDKIDGAIAQTYVDRTGKPLDEIAEMMTAETWLSATDCLAGGFCTEIAQPDEDEPAALNMARRFKALDRFRRVPKKLKATRNDDLDDNANGCECDCSNCQDGNCQNCSNRDCDDPHCEDCPMQAKAGNSSNLSLYEARLRAIQMGASRAA